MNLKQLPRVNLAHLPTPVEALPRLSRSLNRPEIWVKRDDQTGLAFGGNKTRKLEFLVGAALEEGATRLITTGAVQSNHCRQTAAAAAKYGLHCTLILEGDPPETPQGNLLVDQLIGADHVFCPTEMLDETLQSVMESSRSHGEKPYWIPLGGSNPIGAAGYALAMLEFSQQDLSVDRIFTATSSGGTVAGLLAGAWEVGYRGEIVGIRVGPYQGSDVERVHSLAGEIAFNLGIEPQPSSDQLRILDQYHAAGYGVVTDLEAAAIHTFAQIEGLLLDPVYTGRAAGGMLDQIQRGEIKSGERILFWHTGGTPALFAYPEILKRS